ncbi:hypothetical protein ABB37_07917 [Leptomonas pyrrhocoris]|uniref:ACB domain-containing protein n=1 Tax=Leptomonas pyrrhocoris TaxID=157538 RepID=A0A0N0VDS7_LEPPY|nr:hypothetical protein ABB37_07917 [Leptomonas pyrrhocoris]KPA76151.1 hypothetical protein ABB37_07917 [Leptomonas pyrrhocoris]|eukprot:XP_015654590.1 hypothetical protein ABB37_07917 [Leptomonas pyrrhocoris]
MNVFFGAFFGQRRKSDEPMKPVVDPATIVEPVDFFGPAFPYEQGFKEIDAYIRTLPAKGYVPVSDILRLQFYSLYKQATLGDIDESKVKQPSLFRDWEGYWKVVGWRKCKGMPRERARDFYIELFDAQVRKHSKVKWGAPLAEDRWAAFYDGVQRIQNLPKNGYNISDQLRAHVYAMFKQATVGDLKAFQKSEAARASRYKWLRSRPTKAGFDQFRYDEWLKLAGMSTEHAKRLYCKELFHEAALYGYVWDPPGTEGHLEVIGDQTSAKNFKRIDSETLRRRLWIEHPSNDADAPLAEIEGAGVKLSGVEKVALKKFLFKERKVLDSKAGDPNKKTAKSKEVAAEALAIYMPGKAETCSIASDKFVDPNEAVELLSVPSVAADAGKEPKGADSEEAGEEENGKSLSAEEGKSASKPDTPAKTAPAKEDQASATASAAPKEPAKNSAEPTAKKSAAAEPEKTAKTSSARHCVVTKKKNAGAQNGNKTKK